MLSDYPLFSFICTSLEAIDAVQALTFRVQNLSIREIDESARTRVILDTVSAGFDLAASNTPPAEHIALENGAVMGFQTPTASHSPVFQSPPTPPDPLIHNRAPQYASSLASEATYSPPPSPSPASRSITAPAHASELAARPSPMPSADTPAHIPPPRFKPKLAHRISRLKDTVGPVRSASPRPSFTPYDSTKPRWLPKTSITSSVPIGRMLSQVSRRLIREDEPQDAQRTITHTEATPAITSVSVSAPLPEPVSAPLPEPVFAPLPEPVSASLPEPTGPSTASTPVSCSAPLPEPTESSTASTSVSCSAPLPEPTESSTASTSVSCSAPLPMTSAGKSTSTSPGHNTDPKTVNGIFRRTFLRTIATGEKLVGKIRHTTLRQRVAKRVENRTAKCSNSQHSDSAVNNNGINSDGESESDSSSCTSMEMEEMDEIITTPQEMDEIITTPPSPNAALYPGDEGPADDDLIRHIDDMIQEVEAEIVDPVVTQPPLPRPAPRLKPFDLKAILRGEGIRDDEEEESAVHTMWCTAEERKEREEARQREEATRANTIANTAATMAAKTRSAVGRASRAFNPYGRKDDKSKTKEKDGALDLGKLLDSLTKVEELEAPGAEHAPAQPNKATRAAFHNKTKDPRLAARARKVAADFF